jgi:tetratricopeptide (TPR) repeat protein
LKMCPKRLCLLMIASALLSAASPEVDRARKLYERGSYRAAIDALTPAAKAGSDAEALAWLGKSRYMLGDYKGAVEALEQAVSLDAGKSEYFQWLGRSFGRRAESANPLMAAGLATKTRQNFEKAVELDPRNYAAMMDLLEYYLEAPGFMGGGLEKAEGLARRMRGSPADYNFALARLAEKKKDLKGAEEHYRRAAEAAPKEVSRLLDLGRFLAKQGRYDDSEAALAQAEKLSPNAPRILYERANAYIRANQNRERAKQLLEKYVGSNPGPNDPPVTDARKLLKQVS